jgi:hypothetical protein
MLCSVLSALHVLMSCDGKQLSFYRSGDWGTEDEAICTVLHSNCHVWSVRSLLLCFSTFHVFYVLFLQMDSKTWKVRDCHRHFCIPAALCWPKSMNAHPLNIWFELNWTRSFQAEILPLALIIIQSYVGRGRELRKKKGTLYFTCLFVFGCLRQSLAR